MTPPVTLSPRRKRLLLEWLEQQVASTQKNIRSREELARTCRDGTEAEWAEGWKLAGGKKKIPRGPGTKEERLKEAELHERIAARYREDASALRLITVIVAASETNAP